MLTEQPEGSWLYQERWFNRGEKQPELPDSKWEQFLGMSPGVNGSVVSGQTGISAGLLILFTASLWCWSGPPGMTWLCQGCACSDFLGRGASVSAPQMGSFPLFELKILRLLP